MPGWNNLSALVYWLCHWTVNQYSESFCLRLCLIPTSLQLLSLSLVFLSAPSWRPVWGRSNSLLHILYCTFVRLWSLDRDLRWPLYKLLLVLVISESNLYPAVCWFSIISLPLPSVSLLSLSPPSLPSHTDPHCSPIPSLPLFASVFPAFTLPCESIFLPHLSSPTA